MGPRGKPPRVPLPSNPNPKIVLHPELPLISALAHDYGGWHWSQLPYGERKAARCGHLASDIIIDQVECVGCRRNVWTCSPERENLCEECEYYWVNDFHEERVKHEAVRARMRPVNPFGESNEPPMPSWWPRREE